MLRVGPGVLNGETGAVSVGIRPEKLRVGGDEGNSLTGEIVERAYVGVSTQYVVRTAVGDVTVFVQGAGSQMPGEQIELTFAPEATFVVSRSGGQPRMNELLTRDQVLRRALAGGAFLTIPGLLAACGGGGSKSAATTTTSGPQTMPSSLTWSNWPLYIDVDEKTKTHPTLVQFQKHYAVKVQVPRGHQRQRQLLREDRRAAFPGPVDRARHHRPHRFLGSARPNDRTRLAREARQVGDPEHEEPAARSSGIRRGTRTATTACPGSRA